MCSWKVVDTDAVVGGLVANILGGSVLQKGDHPRNGDCLAVAIDSFREGGATGYYQLGDGFQRYTEIVATSGLALPVIFYGWPHRLALVLDENPLMLDHLQKFFDVKTRLLSILDLSASTQAEKLDEPQ